MGPFIDESMNWPFNFHKQYQECMNPGSIKLIVRDTLYRPTVAIHGEAISEEHTEEVSWWQQLLHLPGARTRATGYPCHTSWLLCPVRVVQLLGAGYEGTKEGERVRERTEK